MINFINNLNTLIKKYIFPFYKSKDLKKLFQLLEKNHAGKQEDAAMFVGGCVRNFLNKKKIDDIDIATIYSTEEIKDKLKHSDFKVFDTGVDHGSLTVTLGKQKYELTTLRKDIRSDGRHSKIEIISDWKEDSNRRDFTINAIYMSKDGKLFDPQNGIDDLRNNIIKFIGDPQTRIKEDFLRIIRYLRFSIQYQSIVDDSTLEAIRLNLNGIKKISKERILNEFTKILNLKNFYKINDNEKLKSIFLLIFPEIKYLNRIKKTVSDEKIFYENIINKFALLTVDETNNYEYFCHKYKTSNKVSERIKVIAKEYSLIKKDKKYFETNIKKMLYFLGKETVEILNLLQYADKIQKDVEVNKKKYEVFSTTKERINKIKIPKFPYDGEYLKQRGFSEGELLGKTLKLIEIEWVDQNFSISEKKLYEILENQKKY